MQQARLRHGCIRQDRHYWGKVTPSNPRFAFCGRRSLAPAGLVRSAIATCYQAG